MLCLLEYGKCAETTKQHAPHWLERITVKHRNRIKIRFWPTGGGFDRNTIEPLVILAMIEYIHGNPVRKELVVKPEDWKWSSPGWAEGKNPLRPDPVDFGGPIVVGVG
jgi:putative transposase